MLSFTLLRRRRLLPLLGEDLNCLEIHHEDGSDSTISAHEDGTRTGEKVVYATPRGGVRWCTVVYGAS